IHAEAPAFFARDFVAQLPAATRGNIINIIDERVLDLSPAHFSYTLSKSVLWTMTRTLAQSLAPNIRVNAIAPGVAVAPPDVAPEAHARRNAELPLGHAADAEGIADGVIAILSLPTLTGQMLALDGGEHLEWPARRGPTPRRRCHPQLREDAADHAGRVPDVRRGRRGRLCRQGAQPQGARHQLHAPRGPRHPYSPDDRSDAQHGVRPHRDGGGSAPARGEPD